VLHVHSIANTLMSRIGLPHELQFEGHEMQKAITGNDTHAAQITLPVPDNSRDLDELAAAMRGRYNEAKSGHGFLIRTHAAAQA